MQWVRACGVDGLRAIFQNHILEEIHQPDRRGCGGSCDVAAQADVFGEVVYLSLSISPENLTKYIICAHVDTVGTNVGWLVGCPLIIRCGGLTRSRVEAEKSSECSSEVSESET
eukprot:1536944-Pyramimonas_sp.AAC.1